MIRKILPKLTEICYNGTHIKGAIEWEEETRKLGGTNMSQNCYMNRELSWLKFNERVLEEAKDANNPLCEKMSFASIFQSNLDEFFMVRVGTLYDQMLVSPKLRDNKTNMTSKEQLHAIFSGVKELSEEKDRIYAGLMDELKDEGVEMVDFRTISEEEETYLREYFNADIKPLLSPQIIGKKQPFPFLKNKEIYAVVVLEKKGADKKGADKKGNAKIGIVPCSNSMFRRMIEMPGHPGKFILAEELILHFLPSVFERYSITSKSLIRIIRNADIEPDEETYGEDSDFRKIMERLVRKRKKLCPIKLEYTLVMDEAVIDSLCKYLGLSQRQVFHSEAPLDLSFMSGLRDYLRNKKELFYGRRVSQRPACIDPKRGMMEQIREKDRLLSYPYESIKPFLNLLNEAASDPEVVSIKMTLYRVANNSKVVEALINAAENGKDVVVLVELRARFDEENNIGWSRRLEDAGCRIIYGLDGMKVHSKLCLITRKTDEAISFITQIGTGNYNEKTATLYTDLSLMTADTGIGMEANEVFNALCMGQVMESTKYLLVAPKCLQNKVMDKMDRQIALAREGKEAYIGAKINSLTDKKIIDKLIEASREGVKVELIIRGICCLVAGIPGETENITIRSIVGRFLEHSRIYIFGKEDPEVYIASADYMTRNTVRRVEVAAPIYDAEIKNKVLGIFDTMMRDNVKARVQQPDGNYVYSRNDEEPLNAQEFFYQQAYDAIAEVVSEQ